MEKKTALDKFYERKPYTPKQKVIIFFSLLFSTSILGIFLFFSIVNIREPEIVSLLMIFGLVFIYLGGYTVYYFFEVLGHILDLILSSNN